jgi:hypothetical protein
MSIEYKFRPIQKWPRKETPRYHRKANAFRQTLSDTYKILEYELSQLNAESPVIIQGYFRESDIRIDGLPRSDAKPGAPGIIITFKSRRHGLMNFCCDDCSTWEHNVRAIALTLERLRKADIYGVTKSGEQYAGWKQLPGAIVTPPPMDADEAMEILRKFSGIPSTETAAPRDHFRAAAMRFHPDKSGGHTNGEWLKIQAAWEVFNKRGSNEKATTQAVHKLHLGSKSPPQGY